jgi:putative ABC transport system ATP-binding protein
VVNKSIEIARLEGASKVYKSGDSEVIALSPTDIRINTGQLVLIIGPSGSGKTTLLSLLGCVIYPTQGKVFVNGVYTSDLSDAEMAKLRLNNMGFVFQSFNLIAPLSVEENVMLPLILRGENRTTAKAAAREALDKLGMNHRLDSLPKMLSGGEQQRVAIARALVSDPPMILCDEPTASLDVASTAIVMKKLQELAKEDKAVIVVTHDQRLIPFANRIIEVTNGTATERTETEYIKDIESRI